MENPLSTGHRSLLCLLLAFLIHVLPTHGQCPQLVWSDEFDGDSLDESKWSYQNGDGCQISQDLCGWGNNELQYYRPENAVVSDGYLTITAKREAYMGRDYTSARLRTIDKGDWTYGRMEARIKLPTGQGIWPAFWMLPTDNVYGGWPQSGEIDIMELIGNQPATVHGTLHYGQPWPNNASSSSSFDLYFGEIFNDDFHEFAVEWEPEEIRWYVDGYLYARKTPDDLLPQNWPFDEDFHILLNLAVGGNWPGNPDATTSFPQEMVVDYVRVYEGNAPYLSGDRHPQYAYGEDTTTYSVLNAPEDASFQWTVPDFATLTGGQGTSSIQVNFRSWEGYLSVEVRSDCGDRTLRTQVRLNPLYEYTGSLENFDEDALINFDFSTGTLSENVPNPLPEGVNTSQRVGQYARNAAESYDVLRYRTTQLEDADDFQDRKRFYIDIFTDAPEGTEILLQLENSTDAEPGNYPTGRHSRYQAFTRGSDAWERLEFEFLDEPDAGVKGIDVDQIVLLFAPNSNTDDTFYFDNFDVYEEVAIVSTRQAPLPADHFNLFPNPAEQTLQLQYTGESHLTHLEVIDSSGRLQRQRNVHVSEGETASIDLKALPPGAYFLRVTDSAGAVGIKPFVKK